MTAPVRRSLSRRALFGLEEPTKRAASARITSNCLASNHVMCESCAEVCASGAIRFVRRGFIKQPFVDADRCTACEECLSVCPADAIVIERPKQEHA